MSLFSGPEEHAANSPETWTVQKAGNRLWNLCTAGGGVIGTYTTRKAAEAERQSGRWVGLYGKETRWYAGETVHPWKPWAQVLEERERRAAWLASRQAT